MDWVQAVVYGVVQGATEYLPVSSTAHLAIVPLLFRWTPPSFAFDVLVQLGTLLAVCVYLKDDLRRLAEGMLRFVRRQAGLSDPDVRAVLLLGIATLPAVVFGLGFKDAVEAQMSDPRAIFGQLFINGLMIAGADLLSRRREANRTLTPWTALLIGFAQALAILPSISRSGATISAALLLGLPRREAGRFSFLMSIPVMLGAGVIGTKDLLEEPGGLAAEGPGLAIAFVVAALVGFVVIRWFLGFVARHSLVGFGAYCCAVAAVGWFLTT